MGRYVKREVHRWDQRRTNVRIAPSVRECLVEHFDRNDAAGRGPTGWQQLWEMLVDRYMEEQGLEPVPQPKPED